VGDRNQLTSKEFQIKDGLLDNPDVEALCGFKPDCTNLIISNFSAGL
jgi:hypothetical protein